LEKKLRLESEAVEDLAQNYEYYESRKEGLGEEFLNDDRQKINQVVNVSSI